MTIPLKVIEIAVSGGWDSFFSQGFTFNSRGLFDVDTDFTSYEEIALDPTFWQALGKSCGWDLPLYVNGEYVGSSGGTYEWVYLSRAFCALILAGGNTDTFWEEIISSVK